MNLLRHIGRDFAILCSLALVFTGHFRTQLSAYGIEDRTLATSLYVGWLILVLGLGAILAMLAAGQLREEERLGEDDPLETGSTGRKGTVLDFLIFVPPVIELISLPIAASLTALPFAIAWWGYGGPGAITTLPGLMLLGVGVAIIIIMLVAVITRDDGEDSDGFEP